MDSSLAFSSARFALGAGHSDLAYLQTPDPIARPWGFTDVVARVFAGGDKHPEGPSWEVSIPGVLWCHYQTGPDLFVLARRCGRAGPSGEVGRPEVAPAVRLPGPSRLIEVRAPLQGRKPQAPVPRRGAESERDLMSADCTKFVNLTPHPVNMYRFDTTDDVLLTIPTSGTVLRLDEIDTGYSCAGISPYSSGVLLGVWDETGNYSLALPIVSRSLAEPANLPEPMPGTLYVVSLPVLMALKALGSTRRDFVAPDSGPGKWGAHRNEKGAVDGAYRLVTLSGLPEDWSPWGTRDGDMADFAKRWGGGEA